MDLSILTPAIPARIRQLEKLCVELENQIGSLPVEHLVLLDNRRRTVGEKRDALLRAARGAYVAFVDDDDFISHDYVAAILSAIRRPKIPADVITFRQQATVNGVVAEIDFGLGNPNDPFPQSQDEKGVSTILRNAWHVCAWRRSLAIMSHFPALNYGEDWAFAEPLCRIARSEEHIGEVLHFYFHSSETTAAPGPLTSALP
jgi:Glycosyl transferase family 2